MQTIVTTPADNVLVAAERKTLIAPGPVAAQLIKTTSGRRRRSRPRRATSARQSFIVLAVTVALSGLGAGCGADDEPEDRRIALTALLEEFELEPLPRQDEVRIGRTQSKSDYPYFSATGILEMSRASGIAHAESAFEQQGWDLIESGNVSHFLGSCIRARKPSMVAITYVGWSDMPTNNVYPRLPGRVYVQTLVGREGSNQGWTDVERELC